MKGDKMELMEAVKIATEMASVHTKMLVAMDYISKGPENAERYLAGLVAIEELSTKQLRLFLNARPELQELIDSRRQMAQEGGKL